jgi:hypothetical protein
MPSPAPALQSPIRCCNQLVAFSHAVNDGRTAQEFDPNGKAASEVDRLFAWVSKRTNAQAALSANTKTSKRA